jgi:hypothetical protein
MQSQRSPHVPDPAVPDPTVPDPTVPDQAHPPRTGRRRGVRRLVAALALGVLALPLTPVSVPPAAASVASYVVAPWGSDSAAGTWAHPFRTLGRSMAKLRAGDTLVVRGGSYWERVRLRPARGTATRRITVTAAAGENPVVHGLLWLTGADYWTLRNIDVTWWRVNRSNEHMVKMSGGVGWRITGAQIWGARSYAAVLVAGRPRGWRIDHSWIHDTYRTNRLNQDHLIYVNAGMGGGLIDRNVLSRSANGRGIKVGPSSPSAGAVGNLVIRYNTFYDNRGPSNVQLSYGASRVRIYRNIFVRSGYGKPNVTTYRLTGYGNAIADNVGWGSTRVVYPARGLRNAGGNIKANPYLLGYTPRSVRVRGYGRFG